MSSRVKFIDRMAQGKISRRDMLRASAAFGVGMVALPRLALAEGLTVMEWSGYDIPEYCKPFLSKYGQLPNFSIFVTEEDALQKVRGGFSADLMHPCNYSVGRFVEAKLTKPIDTAKLSNWKDIFPALQTAEGVVVNGEVVMAPADWGNSSIAYRTDLVEPDFAANESWNIFTDDRYAGKVSMTDSEVAVQIAGMMMGYPPDVAFHMEGEKLAAVKPIVEKMVKNSRFIWTDATEIAQGLGSGEIVAAYSWNDTPKNLTKEGIKIAFAKPKEGYFTWFCGITMLNTGKGDEAAAYDFVDAWLSPETGKNLIEGSGYGHANVKSFEIANKADVEAMGITDPIKHMASAILFPPLTGSSLAAQIKLWEDMKALKQ
jgi:spermidine/putrescine transport system substrate-binding protein